MKFFNSMRCGLVAVLLVSLHLMAGAALPPPLPSLPPLPSVPAKNADVASSTVVPVASSASSSTPLSQDGAASASPVMLDGAGDKTDAMGSAKNNDAARDEIVQKAIAALDTIGKLVSQFQSLEGTVDTTYTAFDKKMDAFYQDTLASVGKFSMQIDSATSFLGGLPVAGAASNEATQCKTALAEASKMLTALKDVQVSLDKDEDSMRSSIVAFKKVKSDFSNNYGKASSLKNDVLTQEGDGKAQMDQIEVLVKKTQDLYDQMNTKDSPAITSAMKKMDDAAAKVSSDVKALAAQIDKIQGFVVAIKAKSGTGFSVDVPQGGAAASLSVAVTTTPVKSVVASASASTVMSASAARPATLSGAEEEGKAEVEKNMAREVLATIKMACASVWKRISAVFSRERISANATALVKDPEFTQKRENVKSAAVGFGAGVWQLCVSSFVFVKHVFVNLFARDTQSSDASQAAPMSAPSVPAAVSPIKPVVVAPIQSGAPATPALSTVPSVTAPAGGNAPGVSVAKPAVPALSSAQPASSLGSSSAAPLPGSSGGHDAKPAVMPPALPSTNASAVPRFDALPVAGAPGAGVKNI